MGREVGRAEGIEHGPVVLVLVSVAALLHRLLPADGAVHGVELVTADEAELVAALEERGIDAVLRQPLRRFVDELAHAVFLDHAGVGDVVAVLTAHRHRRARADRADADDALRIEDRGGGKQRRIHPGAPDRPGFVLLDQADDGVDRLPVLGNIVIGRPLDGDDLVTDLEPAAFARLRRNGLDDAVALHELFDGEPHRCFLEETQERGRARQREDAAELEGVFGLRELRAGHKACAERRTKQPCPNCAKR